MNENFTLTGGARIGRANATYPFANLFVNKDVLKINASVVGNLVFQPQDIISIEPYTMIPILGQGIKINHRIENYNPKVIFWTFKDPNFVINEIKRVGFLDNINSKISFADTEIIKRQEQGGFPIKKPVAIIFVILWNILFLSDFLPFFLQNKKEGIPIGSGVKMAIGLLLATSILTLISDSFRKIILKEGRDFNDIKKFVYFVILISGLLLFAVVGLPHFRNKNANQYRKPPLSVFTNGPSFKKVE